jgi:hypothetical protein
MGRRITGMGRERGGRKWEVVVVVAEEVVVRMGVVEEEVGEEGEGGQTLW